MGWEAVEVELTILLRGFEGGQTTTTAKAEADPCGMTNKSKSKSKSKGEGWLGEGIHSHPSR
jgi:hypothetical protein